MLCLRIHDGGEHACSLTILLYGGLSFACKVLIGKFIVFTLARSLARSSLFLATVYRQQTTTKRKRKREINDKMQHMKDENQTAATTS